MATIKIKFRASNIDDKEGSIYYQIIHDGVIRHIKTGFKVFNNEWLTYEAKIFIGNINEKRSLYLNIINTRIKMDIKRLECIVKSLSNKNYTIDDILDIYQKQHKGKTLFNFMLEIITRYNELGKIRTAETYVAALSSFITFQEGSDISLNLIDSDLLESYESFLKHKGITLNTISFYMKKLRAVYNRAIDKKLLLQQNPFKKVYTSIEKTNKRAIPLKYISRIKDLDLSLYPDMEFARDIFLFSFYTRGMSFVDIAYLRKKDLKNGVLNYIRRKTGQRLQIKWEKCMQIIIEKYNDKNIEYMFPIIINNYQHRKQYIDYMGKINKLLKKVAFYAGLECNLTMYVARHSWASVAKSKNIPISVICEGMGHDSENTTQIYLAALESEVIDKANKLILNSI